MERLYDVFYRNKDGKQLSARYCCIDKSVARRLFFSEIEEGEKLIEIKEVKE